MTVHWTNDIRPIAKLLVHDARKLVTDCLAIEHALRSLYWNCFWTKVRRR